MGITEKEFREMLDDKILVIDGAMGTSLQKMNLQADDFGGLEYEGCNEYLLVSKPSAIIEVHKSYLHAGCDILETCTFGSTPVVLSEYGLSNEAHRISKLGALTAKQAVEDYRKESGSSRRILIAGSMGPTTKTLSVTRGITFHELVESYKIQALGLAEGGADLMFLETAQDTLNLKAGIIALNEVFNQIGYRLPIMISGTIEPMGTMLGGQGVESLAISLEHGGALTLGINCATGPAFMTDHIRTLAESSKSYISCVPNAGLPDENGKYNETPEDVVKVLERFADSGWLNLVGGCCGTTPEHIKLMAEMAKGKKPRKTRAIHKSRVSGIEPLTLDSDNRPYMIAERTNSLGSKIFRNLIAENKLDEAAEIARKQVKAGAHIIDVCLQNPDRNEIEDMEKFIQVVVKKTKAPLMIDTTDEKVLETSLEYIQGKVIYNSMNLENGEEKFASTLPILKKFGAAAVVGCIDEDKKQGMGVTVERKLEIAEKSYKILTEKYNYPEEDIYFDPLVFPVGSGDEQYILSAEATVNGVREIKKKFPASKTVLGISNVSFGLPESGREVLNSVFLYHCVQAGLDAAIVNTQKLMRYPSIPEEEKKLAENLLFHNKETYAGALTAFSEYFKKKSNVSTVKKSMDNLSLDERLENYIIEGTVDGLEADLNEKLKELQPLQIINGPLMSGMAKVGKLFNENQLIVSEVLQSAESMKRAVTFLETFMDKNESSVRGKMLLATVKGDVHDIGKNLVEIILSNNGYKVIDLGIKVPPEDIIRAHKEHSPDMIGLSGLLVKSALQMAETAQDLKNSGISTPILVGGAALSEAFTRNKIQLNYEGSVIYARDAMTGLDLANQLTDTTKRDSLLKEWTFRDPLSAEGGRGTSGKEKESTPVVRELISHSRKRQLPPDLVQHFLPNIDLDEVSQFLNPVMLYKKHLGYKGNIGDGSAEKDPKFVELRKNTEFFLDECIRSQYIKASACFRFFRAVSEGNDLIILDSSGKSELKRFHFRRQEKGSGLCLSDFVAPRDLATDDSICLFAVTAGIGVRQRAEGYKNKGEYLKSHMLSAIALETAEATAEYIHKKIRGMWGIPDPANISLQEIFQARYTGLRVSFGYPSCPDLSDQVKLFDLLKPPVEMGLSLTEGYMMDPEASVSALAFNHPDARYFTLE